MMRSILTPVSPDKYLSGPNSLADVEFVLISSILFSIENIESFTISILLDNLSSD